MLVDSPSDASENPPMKENDAMKLTRALWLINILF